MTFEILFLKAGLVVDHSGLKKYVDNFLIVLFWISPKAS